MSHSIQFGMEQNGMMINLLLMIRLTVHIHIMAIYMLEEIFLW